MAGLDLNFLREKRNQPKLIMPIYQYQVINGKKPAELFEVEQKLSDSPLTHHPLTHEPIIRVINPVSLTLKHGSINENQSLSPDNLKSKGFTCYEKDSSGDYHRTVGNGGPAKISPGQYEDTH